jgi:hypothetical protein
MVNRISRSDALLTRPQEPDPYDFGKDRKSGSLAETMPVGNHG